MRPTRYYVSYWDTDAVNAERARIGCDDIDPANVCAEKDFSTMAAAKKFFRQCEARREGPQLWERSNIRDVTPDGDPSGLLWEWDPELRGD